MVIIPCHAIVKYNWINGLGREFDWRAYFVILLLRVIEVNQDFYYHHRIHIFTGLYVIPRSRIPLFRKIAIPKGKPLEMKHSWFWNTNSYSRTVPYNVTSTNCEPQPKSKIIN